MLDPHGFVATCNSTHFFIVRKGEVWTSSGKYCLGGITRGLALEVAREAGIPAIEKDFSLTDVYGADEAFVTGTFAGHRAGARGRRPPARPAAGRWSSGCSSSTPSASSATSGSSSGRDPPHRHVVGAAQPLHGDDAQLRQPGRHLRLRRAVLRLLPQDDRRRPSDARRGDRGDGLRLAQRHGVRCAGRRPDGSPVWYQKHMWHHMSGPIGYDDFAGFTHAFLIREPERMIASYLRKREAARVRGFRARPPGRILRARGRPARPCAAGGRRATTCWRTRKACCRSCARRSASRGTRRCSAGRPAAATPTARGRRTGTARSRRAPASARPKPTPVELPDDAQRLADRCRPYYERLAASTRPDEPLSRRERLPWASPCRHRLR